MPNAENTEPLAERLLQTIAECERRRRENAHLKKLLSGLSLITASDLETDADSGKE